MDTLSTLTLIMVVLVTSAAIVGVTYLLIKQYFDHQKSSGLLDWKSKLMKEYVPLQIQAYERIILYLERIHPERLVFRVAKPGMSARQLQADVLKIIREEFDHNLAQQLYISPEAWEATKAAREATIDLLGQAAERVHRDADAMAFSQAILELAGAAPKLPTEVAILHLKKEFRKKMQA